MGDFALLLTSINIWSRWAAPSKQYRLKVIHHKGEGEEEGEGDTQRTADCTDVRPRNSTFRNIRAIG